MGCSFFGMKPTSSREFMVRKLRDIDLYLNGCDHVNLASASVSRGRPTKRSRTATENHPSEDRATDDRAAQAAIKASDLERRISEAIRADTELYERLITFEPVALSEIRERVVAASPDLGNIGEGRLRNFLDAQGL